MSRTTRALAAAFAALFLLLGTTTACSKKSSTTSGTTTSAEEESAGTTESPGTTDRDGEGETEGTSKDDEEDDDDEGTTTTRGEGSGQYTAWCDEMAAADERFSDLEDDPSIDDENFEAAFREVLAVWNQLAASAPAEIKADMELIADGIQRFIDGDPSILDEEAAAPYDAASERLNAFVLEHCGLDLEGE
jgi:hypothetical protein